MATARSSVTGMLGDYARLRTIPALLSVLFAATTLYQFGGVSQPTFEWVGYTLVPAHAMLVSLGAYIVAFASSETKEWRNYTSAERVLIAAGILIVFGQQQITAISSMMAAHQPASGIVAYLITMLGWGVAVR